MGCVSSKESQTCIRRLDHDDDDDAEARHVVSLTSSSYGLLNMDRPSSPPSSSCQGSFLIFHRKSRKYQALTAFDNSMSSPGPDTEHLEVHRNVLRKKKADKQGSPLLQSDGKARPVEVINTRELMEGLEDMHMPPRGSCNRKLRSPISSESNHISNSLLPESGSPVWKKYYAESEMVKEGLMLCRISPTHSPSPQQAPHESPQRAALACMPFVKSLRRLPSNRSPHEQDDSKSTSSNDPPDRSSPGLKLLLSSANSPSYYARMLPKKAGIHSVSLSFDGNTESLRKTMHVKFKRSFDFGKRSSRQQSMDSSMALDAPAFDPSLIAKFEQAVDKATLDCSREDLLQQSTDEITTNSSSSDNTWPSSEMASDAESRPFLHKQEKQTRALVIPSPVDKEEDVAGLLTKHEARCPSKGNGKVVLYHTSLRGVRKTYEDCRTVQVILKGLGVHVDERDVWMHAKYKEELLDALGDDLQNVQLVPQLFIKGKYIGGAKEVKRLHENGSLASLMDGITRDMFPRACDGCGDVRFVPCLKCSGSCKVRNRIGEVSRCLVCNENGLIMCPICTTA